MTQELMLRMETGGVLDLPKLIEREVPKTSKRFLEFFTANIRNLQLRPTSELTGLRGFLRRSGGMMV